MRSELATLPQLRDRLAPPAPAAATVSLRWGAGAPVLERAAVHEWIASCPPAALLAGIARWALADRAGPLVWIGRDCWPSPAWLNPDLLRRSVFIDPACDADRAWAIDQSLRCSAVACVVADGRRIGMGVSRRLQLAAGAGGALGLLTRPPDEESAPSAARTRWRVTPTPTPTPHPDARFHPVPRWTVELLRCKGLRPDTDARRWIVQLAHDTRHVSLVPDAADRGVQTPAPAASERRLA